MHELENGFAFFLTFSKNISDFKLKLELGYRLVSLRCGGEMCGAPFYS